MKLLGKSLRRGEAGYAKLVAEEGEDLWHVYNLVREGDVVTATTFRKVQRDNRTSAESEKVKLKLSIRVENVEFDPEGESIRFRGKNLTESEHVKLGAYHTLEIEPHRAFSVSKDEWDSMDINLVTAACDPGAGADLAAVLITEGLAHVFLVGSSCTLTKSTIETSIPKKRGPAVAGYDKAITAFFKRVMDAVVKHVDWGIVKALVIAGPGFTKDEFKKYLDAEAVRQDNRPLILHKSRIITAPASSAYKHALKEVLAAAGVAAQIKDTKAAREVAALQDFYSMLSSDSSRAFYGPAHVIAAHQLGAIQTLLISDKLFRVNNIEGRKKYGQLVEGVVAGGGEALIFSSMHVTGEQLNQLTGIAAILRFPLPDLEDQELGADGELQHNDHHT